MDIGEVVILPKVVKLLVYITKKNKNQRVMTNEEKVRELASYKYNSSIEESNAAYRAAIEAMKWKEEQIIEKAVEWLEKKASSYMSIYWEQGGYATPEFDTSKFIEDFKKTMEE